MTTNQKRLRKLILNSLGPRPWQFCNAKMEYTDWHDGKEIAKKLGVPFNDEFSEVLYDLRDEGEIECAKGTFITWWKLAAQ